MYVLLYFEICAKVILHNCINSMLFSYICINENTRMLACYFMKIMPKDIADAGTTCFNI